ncbi:hypothetical protein B0T19DRAFT_410877 [Cercophora scortea]|uniref:C3H1-type domain-containing protein n=1 Tax=Cercophora scortea TaxID=314031 RepID=A0AAE0J4R7_9PEZI|nr:hypothetical protein B0T19DRAFT_410877 [Cercophora scortea]
MMTPSPRFFIVRPDAIEDNASRGGVMRRERGRFVPLVAVDQFPEWFSIIGIPRELTAEQTVGMHDLGNVSKEGGTYAIQIVHHPSLPSSSADLGHHGDDGADDLVQSPKLEEPEGKAIERGTCTSQEGDILPRSHSMCQTPSSISVSSNSSCEASSITISPSPPPVPVLSSQSASSSKSIEAQFAAFQNSPVLNRDTGNKSNSQPVQTLPLPTTSSLPTNKHPTTKQGKALKKHSITARKSSKYCHGWLFHGHCRYVDSCRYLHAQPDSAEEVIRVLREKQQSIDNKREAIKAKKLQQQNGTEHVADKKKKFPLRKNVKLTDAEKAAINADMPLPLRSGVVTATSTDGNGGGDTHNTAEEGGKVEGKTTMPTQGTNAQGVHASSAEGKTKQDHILLPQHQPTLAESVEEGSLITFEDKEMASVISSSSVPLVTGREKSTALGASSLTKVPTPTDLLD